MERQGVREELRSDELVEGVVATDVLADDHELADRREERGGVEAAGLVECALCRTKHVGECQHHGPCHDRPLGQRVAADRHLVDRRLATDPARGGRNEMPFRHERIVERSRQPHDDRVVRLAGGPRVAAFRAERPQGRR